MVENLQGEEWRDIERYEGWYQVSNMGRVKSLDRTVKGRWGHQHFSEYLLKPNVLIVSGYLQVSLEKNGIRKYRKVHQLVAEAFPEICGEKKEGLQVMHLDGSRDNDVVTNLRYGTVKENANHPQRTRLISEALLCREDQSKTIAQYTLDGDFVKKYQSMGEAERDGFTRSHIRKCCLGLSKFHKDYQWRWLDEKGNPTLPLINGITDAMKRAHLKSRKRIGQYSLNNELIKIWNYSREVEGYGFDRGAVGNCCLCKKGYKTYKGYKWRYIDDDGNPTIPL